MSDNRESNGIWYANKFYYNENAFWKSVSYAFLAGSLVGGSVVHLILELIF